MINSTLYGRVFLVVSLITAGFGNSACTMHGQADSKAKTAVARAGAVRTASVKPARPAHANVPAKAAALATPIVTSSIDPAAAMSGSATPNLTTVIVGKTWNYEYAGSRGTITYLPDGTTRYDEPGLRSGKGKWQLRDNEICQSFSGIKERCVELRQAGKAYYIGRIKLTPAKT